MADPSDHLLLLYDYVEDMADRRGPYRAAHLERIGSEKEAGHVVMAGPLGTPPSGAAIVFAGVDRDHVQRFVREDPYVTGELVTAWSVRPWNLV
jgi:hypothetical protein